MSGDIQVVKRKKDLVTGLAMVLFLILILFEFALVFYIPTQFKRSNWTESTAKAELIEKIDNLRRGLHSLEKRTPLASQKHELELIKDVLNDYAGYLREYKDVMTIGQINRLQQDLALFENYYSKWKKGQYLIKPIKLDLTHYKKEQLIKNGCHNSITKNKKR